MKAIQTDKAPEALGHYEQGICAGDFIFTSMQLPINPQNPADRPESHEDMARQLISNIIEIVRAGGGEIRNIVKVTIYVSDIALWDVMNDVYTEVMGNHKPARSVVPVKDLHKGWPMAMEAVAIKEN